MAEVKEIIMSAHSCQMLGILADVFLILPSFLPPSIHFFSDVPSFWLVFLEVILSPRSKDKWLNICRPIREWQLWYRMR